ncbi:MAG: hypothetical protein QOD60_1832 [Solirubrobacterales bacterium]|nr:hypothetical protein [Solirubrobacterales bacterium]
MPAAAWAWPDLEPEVGRLAMARVQAFMLIAAGVLGAAGELLPHPPSYNEPGLAVIQVSAILLGSLMLLDLRRVPGWLLRVNPYLSIVATNLVIVFSHDVTSAFVLFYLWPVVYSFYFFSRWEWALCVAVSVASYTLLIVTMGIPAAGTATNDYSVMHFLVLTVGTLLVVGGGLVALRERVSALMERLTDAARADGLTGLRNRRGLIESLETEIERARRGHRQVSLLILDLDRFQEVNDRWGHEVGDRLLRRVGAVLERVTQRSDLVARTAGEEFTILLPENDKSRAHLLSERILVQLRRSFTREDRQLTASIGVATYPEDAESADELVNVADHALYAAKVLGRDRVVLFSDEVATIVADRGGKRRSSSEQSHLATVLSLAEALDLRDDGTARHSQTVGRLAELIGTELELPQERVDRLRLAGVLHDIGKVGIPDSVLQKPGPLDDDEWAQMRRHPELGARLLSGHELGEIRSWLLAHHERPDGGGYPHGLGAEEIPLEASILAAADAYEAMTADRVYRRAIGEEAARDELRRCSGTQFDPGVVEALLAVLDGNELKRLVEPRSR